ncbi:hypothetical protein [Actinomycetospora cinnamomea]|uniref:Uncharacterized protein n=1 Tax=Actinomycetospora cinnamomea TaxID=663609 RepID=A0A2U1E7U2_9PSEU|nr:hypothetical protein [Actinomycetospora cinnamomea]PVY96024.1 hypothetical protein C8D89_13320 [Actinomycetospora cinnamomea]
MTEQPSSLPSDPTPTAPPAADPGEQAPDPAEGFGEHPTDVDVPPSDEPGLEGDRNLTDAVHERPDPPFRTPAPDDTAQ